MKYKKITHNLTRFFYISVALTCVFGIVRPAQLMALNGSDFQSGRIIDDAVFNNSESMSPGQIQDFLNAKVPNCDSEGALPYAGTTRRAYSESKGVAFPLVCLKDYYENPETHENNLSGNPIPSGAKSAAQIIYDVGRQYSINPQVILVMLQKEQALVMDDWPWPIQYRSAMGYGCPDTAACDSTYYGFYNQVVNAAWQFRRYASNPNSYSHVAGINNQVRYNPDASCGSGTVFIQNQSTASLYNYTPYQPNVAALSNLYGTGDGCSAYGNRNFWRYFTEWFGSTFSTTGPVVRNIRKTTYGRANQVFTATDSQIFENAWWDGSGGLHKSLITNTPSGERITDIDKINIPNSTAQAVFFSTWSGVYKATWNGDNPTVTKIVSGLSDVKQVIADGRLEDGTYTYRLYILTNDGPYEVWWRDGTEVSSPYRLWNINNGLDMVKTTAYDGCDEVYVATNGEVYRMKWPVNGGIERKTITTLRDTVAIDKQTLNDGTELLYTATQTGVHETWWRPDTGFSNPAKIITSKNPVVSVQKTMTSGYHQVYVAEVGAVNEYWWGPGSNGIHGSRVVTIPQRDVMEFEKVNIGSYQNIYTSRSAFVYETWWGNGAMGNAEIINISR
ncbi:MAG: hypothetical protein PVI21_02545 [Candidatus Woesebacteria bacterium]|jgi:hypothetical protein